MNDPGNPRENSRKYIYLLGVGLLLVIMLGWTLLNLNQVGLFSQPSFHGTEVLAPEPLADFTLLGPNGQPVSLTDFGGRLILLYFGYTYCPDICPATLGELALARKRLGANGNQVQVIMVTVDPERDTPDVLADYLGRFDPSFMGLSGTIEEIASVAVSLGIVREKQEGTIDTGYLVNHTGSVLAIDGEGRLRLLFPPGTKGKDIAADLGLLLKGS